MMLSLLSPAGAKAKLSILVWHRVLAEPDPLFPEQTHARQFDEVLGWVKQAFNVLPLDVAAQKLLAGTLPARALAITFDDGYENNASVALPLLQKHGLNATIYVCTGFLDGGVMWNDCVIESIRHAPEGEFDAGSLGKFALQDMPSRRRAINSLIQQMKYLDFETRKNMAEDLARRAQSKVPTHLMMSSDQVRMLHKAGMVIGAHTCVHPILTRVPPDVARREIVQGKAQLESMIGAPVTTFAYPNGVPQRDYAYEHVQMVREAGFSSAVCTAWGVSDRREDIFQLRRFTPWDTSKMRFLMRMGQNLWRKPEMAQLTEAD